MLTTKLTHWFIRLLCHQLGTAVAIISVEARSDSKVKAGLGERAWWKGVRCRSPCDAPDEAREHIDEVIVIRRGVADGDASVDESELTREAHHQS